LGSIVPNEPNFSHSEGARVTSPAYSQEGAAGEAGFGILDILLMLAAQKKLIIYVTALGSILSAIISLCMPNMYTGTALIMPPQQQQQAASALLAQVGSLTGAASGLGLKSPADLYIGLLGSRTIADHLIEHFKLQTVYQAKTTTSARKKLQRLTRFASGKDTLIKIDVEDKDPQRAAAMANFYVKELNMLNSSLAVSDANQRRGFLESRLKQEKDALSTAEDEMKRTQLSTGVFHLDGQAQVAIATIAQLRAQITAGEVAFQRLTLGATPQNPEVLRTESELAMLRSRLRELERSGPRDAGDPLLTTSSIPQAGLEYVRGVRELKYHETLFELLSKQYEAARIDEARAAPEIGVVDYAIPAERKSGPPRFLLLLVGAFGSAVLAVILALLRNLIKRPEEAARLRSLKSMFWSW
jgi:tyrosine-protein kinase Etk/Wzc